MCLKLTLFLCCLSACHAYKILLIAHMPVRSLNILGEGYARHLLNAGHEVTYMSVYPIKNAPDQNFRHIDLGSTNINLISQDDVLNIGHLIRNPPAEVTDISYIQDMGRVAVTTTLENEQVRKFLEDRSEKFDVVISELFESEMFAAFPQHPQRRSEWTAILAQNKRDVLYKPSHTSVVGSAYFPISDIYRTNKGLNRLTITAKPVLNMSEIDDDDLQSKSCKTTNVAPMAEVSTFKITTYSLAQDFHEAISFQDIYENVKKAYHRLNDDSRLNCDARYRLGVLYGCPFIWGYSMGPHWLTLRLVDETTSPAYGTDYLTPDTAPFHSMYQRLYKFWVQIKWFFTKWVYTKPQERTFYEKYFDPLFAKRDKPLPDYEDVIYNASMILSNEFPGNGLMPSVPQNFKFVGGYHIEDPPKPLPKEISTILDNAIHGFIYFSMGSTWKSKDIPKEVTEGLLDMFGTLKETVIWKYEEELQNVPNNVHIFKWAPQTSILAHPNILFFITHGGLLSTTEAVHFGVPVIGVPIYFDQFVNINRGVARGSALRVDLSMNLPKDLKLAVDKMIKDKTFKKHAEEISSIYHDRPVPPGMELVHWVEHVARTRGAQHLRSPASLMPWWEKLFMDIIALSLLVVIIIVSLVKNVIKILFGSKKTVSHKKKKNN